MIQEVVPGRIWQADTQGAAELCLWWKPKNTRGIRGVLNVAYNVSLRYPEKLPILHLPVNDYDNVPAAWYEIVARFHHAFGATLVHCAGGKNRSSAFIIALLIADGMAIEEARERVLKPTPPLLASLLHWEKTRER